MSKFRVGQKVRIPLHEGAKDVVLSNRPPGNYYEGVVSVVRPADDVVWYKVSTGIWNHYEGRWFEEDELTALDLAEFKQDLEDAFGERVSADSGRDHPDDGDVVRPVDATEEPGQGEA